MTEQELRELAASVEGLKRAVKRNNPLLRGMMMSSSGWLPLTLLVGVGIALFCLPAQILVGAYGSFAAIPAVFRSALWCVLALVLVLSFAWKMILLTRKASEVDKEAGLGAAMRALFAGPSFHIGIPFVIVMLSMSAFAIFVGHPWYVVPAIAIPCCFWANFVAIMIDGPAFTAAGWWTLITGIASLSSIEEAPFIWLFVVFGGLCIVFAGAVMVSARRERTEGR